jgi:hypothetical protein
MLRGISFNPQANIPPVQYGAITGIFIPPAIVQIIFIQIKADLTGANEKGCLQESCPNC